MLSESLGVLIRTHHRIEDARVNMDVIRSTWGDLAPLVIVHVYNGLDEWYESEYLEDYLVRLPNRATHYAGAAHALDAGLRKFLEIRESVTYVVALDADSWVTGSHFVGRLVQEMREAGKRLASARWRMEPFADGLVSSVAQNADLLPRDGLATDFFILDLPWAINNGMLPLNYEHFLTRNYDILNYAQEMPLLERYLAGRFLGAVRNEMVREGFNKDPWGSAGPRRAREALRLMNEREIDPTGEVAPPHKGYWPNLALITTEDQGTKAKYLRQHTEVGGSAAERWRSRDATAL